MEAVHGHGCAGQPHPQGLAERRGGVDRHGLDSEPPRQGTGEQPLPDACAVASVHDAQHLAGVQVHDRGHPRLDPLPRRGLVLAEPAHRSVAVLVDPEPLRSQGVHVRQGLGGCVEGLLDQPPRHPVRRGGLCRGTAGDHDRLHQGAQQPVSRACPAWDLVGGLGERTARAGRLGAEPAPLAPDHHRCPGDRNIAQALEPAVLHSFGDDPAARAARHCGGLDRDPADAETGDRGGEDAVFGQVEDHGGSAGLLRRRLDQGSWFLTVADD